SVQSTESKHGSLIAGLALPGGRQWISRHVSGWLDARKKGQRPIRWPLSAGPAIVNFIGGLFPGFCQFQILFFGGWGFFLFSEVAILRSLLWIVVRVVHAMRLVRLSNPAPSLSRYYGGSGACQRGCNIEVAQCRFARLPAKNREGRDDLSSLRLHWKRLTTA